MTLNPIVLVTYSMYKPIISSFASFGIPFSCTVAGNPVPFPAFYLTSFVVCMTKILGAVPWWYRVSFDHALMPSELTWTVGRIGAECPGQVYGLSGPVVIIHCRSSEVSDISLSGSVSHFFWQGWQMFDINASLPMANHHDGEKRTLVASWTFKR